MLTATSSSHFELTLHRVVPQDEHYSYDGLYQVKSYQQGYLNESRTAIGGQPIKTEKFAYDPAGNWLGYDLEGGPVLVSNRDNQLVQMNGSSANLAYDKAGNMTQTPDSTFGYNVGGGPMTLVWDAWNRRGSGISYDGLSRRITVGLGNDCYYNDQWKPVEERKFEATTPYCEYYWGARHRDDLTLRRRDSDDDGELDETIWVTHDYFSPTTLLLEMDEPYHHGDPVLRVAYSPFGMMRYLGPVEIAPGDMELGMALEQYDWSYGFQGQFVDRGSGLYNYGYRDYSPWLGRWLSRDPIGEEGGINLYAYAGNNPVNLVDYLGLVLQGVAIPSKLGSSQIIFPLDKQAIKQLGKKILKEIIEDSLGGAISDLISNLAQGTLANTYKVTIYYAYCCDSNNISACGNEDTNRCSDWRSWVLGSEDVSGSGKGTVYDVYKMPDDYLKYVDDLRKAEIVVNEIYKKACP